MLVGFYGKVVKDGVAIWRCVVGLPKVKFGIPGETVYNTKRRNNSVSKLPQLRAGINERRNRQ